MGIHAQLISVTQFLVATGKKPLMAPSAVQETFVLLMISVLMENVLQEVLQTAMMIMSVQKITVTLNQDVDTLFYLGTLALTNILDFVKLKEPAALMDVFLPKIVMHAVQTAFYVFVAALGFPFALLIKIRNC